MDRLRFLSCVSISLVLRYVLIINPKLNQLISNRVEISTPINAWKRAIEGVHLKELGISPYQGDTFHEPPICLWWYEQLLHLGPSLLPLVFVLCDLATATFLALASRKYLRLLAAKEGGSEANYPKSVASLLVRQTASTDKIPYYVAFVFLINPYNLLTCAGQSTIVFHHLVLAAVLYTSLSGYLMLSTSLLAIAVYQAVFPLVLLAPVSMILVQVRWGMYKNRLHSTLSVCYFYLAACFYLLMTISKQLAGGSYDFIHTTYGAMALVKDLTPNIGLFWYFFTEMFEHFMTFFQYVFIANIFIYVAPLSIRLRREPVLLYWLLLALLAIFKSYPCVGDVGLYLSLLPAFGHLRPLLRQGFLVGNCLVACTLLFPVIWHLWVGAGSANANFYFGLGLAFNTAQIFLMTDMLFAYVKREQALLHGVKTDEDGQLVKMELK